MLPKIFNFRHATCAAWYRVKKTISCTLRFPTLLWTAAKVAFLCGLSAGSSILRALIVFWSDWPTNGLVWVKVKFLRHPVALRYHSSDLWCFFQVFVHEEYRPLLDLGTVRTVVDLGANVGYTSAYFLSHFSDAIVYAIEPEPENFHICQLNLGPYRHRAHTIHAAIWPSREKLCIVYGDFRDGLQWSTRVAPGQSDQVATVDAITMHDVLNIIGDQHIDILKSTSKVLSPCFSKTVPSRGWGGCGR